jgi:hypothetical protein
LDALLPIILFETPHTDRLKLAVHRKMAAAISFLRSEVLDAGEGTFDPVLRE